MSSLFSALTSRSTPTPNSAPFPQQVSSSTTTHTPPTPQQRTTEARAAFDASLASAGASSLDSELQARAKNIHENATRLNEQDRRVQNETDALWMEANSVEKVLDRTERELGRAAGGNSNKGKAEEQDAGTIHQFEDEIAAIERDLDFLDDVLDEVEDDGHAQAASGAETRDRDQNRH